MQYKPNPKDGEILQNTPTDKMESGQQNIIPNAFTF